MILNIKYAERDFDVIRQDESQILKLEQSIVEDISNLEMIVEEKMAFIWEIYKHLYNQYRFIYKDDKDLMLKFFNNELWPNKL